MMVHCEQDHRVVQQIQQFCCVSYKEGLAFTGYCVHEGSVERPVYPPTSILNDFVAGYLGAAGVLAALIRRSIEGGSYVVKLSLARCAMWYPELGYFDKGTLDLSGEQHQLLNPDLMVRQTPVGELQRIMPPVSYSETPSSWADPLLVPRGSSKPEWLT